MRISDWSSDVCSSDLPEREGHEDEAGEARQLELENADEHLHREDEEGDDHQRPGEQQHHDRQEVVEEGREPDHLARLVKQRPCRSEEHTSELQSLMRNSYAVFCLKKKTNNTNKQTE